VTPEKAARPQADATDPNSARGVEHDHIPPPRHTEDCVVRSPNVPEGQSAHMRTATAGTDAQPMAAGPEAFEELFERHHARIRDAVVVRRAITSDLEPPAG